MRVLLILLKIFLFFLSFIFVLIAFVGFLAGDAAQEYILIFVLLAISIGLAAAGWFIPLEGVNKIKENIRPTSPIKSTIKEPKKLPTPSSKKIISTFDFQALTGRILQLIGSIQIIETTTNHDILGSRFTFAYSILTEIRVLKGSMQYNRAVNDAVEMHKRMYFDKIVTDTQIYFSLNPDETEKFEIFFIQMMGRCHKEYLAKQVQEISGLKQKRAIINRYQKLNEVQTDLLNILEDFKTIQGCDVLMSEILDDIQNSNHSTENID